MMSRAGQLVHNYATVEDAIYRACCSAGRKRDEVLLLAVSKFHPAVDILVLAQNGQLDFGENYLQEATSKMEATAGTPALNWHMIGHIQRRKAAQVAGKFTLVHSLDSREVAAGMERKLQLDGSIQDVLIEVNVGSEPQKSGIMPDELDRYADYLLRECPSLNLRGLMCIPPVATVEKTSRAHFACLRNLAESLRASTGLALPHLSMGMSRDFPEAIAEGATIVRIGTSIFGPRIRSGQNGPLR